MWFNWPFFFFFPKKNCCRIRPLERCPGSSEKRVNNFMFLSLMKVTPNFQLSMQSLRLGIRFMKAFPADSIFRLPCECHTACSVSSRSHELVRVRGK